MQRDYRTFPLSAKNVMTFPSQALASNVIIKKKISQARD